MAMRSVLREVMPLTVLQFAVAILVLFPFFWMLSVSLKPASEPFAIPARLWPEHPTLQNYVLALRPEFRRYFVNSIVVSGATVLITVPLALLAAYSMTRYQFRAISVFFAAVILAQFFPTGAMIIPDLQDGEGRGPAQHLCLSHHRIHHGDAAGRDLDAARLPVPGAKDP